MTKGRPAMSIPLAATPVQIRNRMSPSLNACSHKYTLRFCVWHDVLCRAVLCYCHAALCHAALCCAITQQMSRPPSFLLPACVSIVSLHALLLCLSEPSCSILTPQNMQCCTVLSLHIGMLMHTQHAAMLCAAISLHQQQQRLTQCWQHTPTNCPSAWLHVAHLQSISPLVHAASASQNQAGVGVLHPLLHLALELATPSEPSQEGLQVVTVKVSPATHQGP